MLLIYVPVNTPRIKYIFSLIFEKRSGIKYNITNNAEDFIKHQYEKLNYSGQRFNDEFFIKAHGVLNENFINQLEVPVTDLNGTKVLFHNSSDDLGFDIFSATFFMISRYEEYLPFSPDNFGRFKAIDSLAFKNNFLNTPIVDKWISAFKGCLQKKFPAIQYSSEQFTTLLTYDIDVAYKYTGRSLKRTIGATFKDVLTINLQNLYNRFQTLFTHKKDPWDVYSYLQKIIIENKISSIFFFLVGDNSTNDRNLNYRNPLIKKLINTIKMFSDIGLHPSFTTTRDAAKIAKEKIRLENISQTSITKSRQHYLKFHFPETYNSLIESGISQDYSMAYPDAAGFRAGTCHPFNFYDLKNEEQTNLLVYSCAFMDGNYINSSKSTEVVLQEINKLIDEIISVNGTFISIWHNHTVSETRDYRRWKKVHDALIERIKSIK